jgi:hypothetical protein
MLKVLVDANVVRDTGIVTKSGLHVCRLIAAMPSQEPSSIL